jgi:hypothetical protein
VRILAWPTTTLAIVLLLRSEIRSFARTLSGRMESAKSIVLGHKGLEIKGGEAVIPGEVQRRRTRLERFLKKLSSKSELDMVCFALNIEPSPNLRMERRNILIEIARLAVTSSGMDALSDMLMQITGQDF